MSRTRERKSRLEARLVAAAEDFRELPSPGLRAAVLSRLDEQPRESSHRRWRDLLALAATVAVLFTLATRLVPDEVGVESSPSVRPAQTASITRVLPDRLGELATESSDALQRTVSRPLRSELDALVVDASKLANAILGRAVRPLRSLVRR